MRLNPVTRGDLRARTASPKIVWVVRLYVAVLGLLAVFTLPAEGPLPGLADRELTQLLLLFTLGWIAYLTSALAVGEIGVEGEKALLDLAVTSFSPETIAAGKVLTSAIFAAVLVLAAAPLVALVVPLDPARVGAVVRALSVMIVVAVPLGAVGTWLTVAVPSDLVRTLVHWSLFLGLFAATRWLAAPLALVNPLRLVAAAYQGAPGIWPVAMAPYLLVTAGGVVLIARSVRRVREAAL